MIASSALLLLLHALSAPLPVLPPARAGMSAQRLARIDAVVLEAIERKETPGAVVLVGRRGNVVFRKAYGARALVPEREPMTADTIFDLASLTKAVATAPAVMTLVEDGKVRLSDRVVRYLPEFGAGGGARERVTIEDLLTHRSGLPPDDPMELYHGTREEIFARKYARPLAGEPGRRFVYSDVGYEVLAELVSRVTGEGLDEYARRRLFAPLEMKETRFNPLAPRSPLPVSRIAPTERVDGAILRGIVHDPRARPLGGVAGHAGLFSTADDVARFAMAILAGGKGVLSPLGVAAMTRPRPGADGTLRGLGWDVETSYSSNRGDLLPLGSFGHSGWTGTSLWIDPATGLFVVILANRVHPDGSGNVVPLRSKVASVAASALTDVSGEKIVEATSWLVALTAPKEMPSSATPKTEAVSDGNVAAGVDVLVGRGFDAIAKKRVALLTNRTGRTKDGLRTVDVLRSPGARAAGV
ncbi:MAG TPA: serine hydrolase domain-containing protein, partial [Thermoanaerobaculia bacterium]|nr:serine hydrolase domain-containing protein [Thermoanaerobaculia bacterium]